MKNLFTKTDSRLHRNDNSRYRHISTRRLTLMLMAIAMMILAPQGAKAQNEILDFYNWQQETNATVVFGDDYPDISYRSGGVTYMGKIVTQITSNSGDHDIGGRIAFKSGTRGWDLTSYGNNHGLQGYHGTGGSANCGFAIRNLWNGDRVKVYFSNGALTFKEANSAKVGGSFVTAGQELGNGVEFTAVKTGDILFYPTINRTFITKIEITHWYNGMSASGNVSWNNPPTTMNVGDDYNTNNNGININPSWATPVFTSSNDAVVTVDQYGYVKAVGVGTATIKAQLNIGPEGANGAQSASDQFTVNVKSATTSVNTYNFQSSQTGTQQPDMAGSGGVADGANLTLMDFTGKTYLGTYFNHPDDRFAVRDFGWNVWNYDNSYLNKGFKYTDQGSNPVTPFYITGLQNGDVVKIWYTGDMTIGSANCDKPLGSGFGGGSAITMEEDGLLKLNCRDGVNIIEIQIEHESSPSMSFPAHQGNYIYDLTTLVFNEPGLSVSPEGAKVTYSTDKPSVAKIGNQETGDVMFSGPGEVTITATAVINGHTYTASYTVTSRADDAVWAVENGNHCYFPETNVLGASGNNNTGMLYERRVESVPFITMTFGDADNSNTTLVRMNNGTRSSMILDSEGWEHMAYELDRTTIKPVEGTFYKFTPDIDGTLTISGVRKSGKTNSVVLYDADATTGTRDTYTLSSGIGQLSFTMENGASYQPGNTVDLTSNGNIVATLQFGVNGETGAFTASNNKSITGPSGTTYQYYTAGNGNDGSQNSGSVYYIVPQYTGEIEVAVVLNSNQPFYILEDGVPMLQYNGLTMSEKYYGTFSFIGNAGSTYTIYAQDSKLGLYGFTFRDNITYQSYPQKKVLSFNGDVAVEEGIQVQGGHTYYLYGNTTETSSGSDWQVFYLSGFTFSSSFEFADKAVVMDKANAGIQAAGYKHVPYATSYKQSIEGGSVSSNVTYSLECKGGISASINSTDGTISDISGEGAIVVKATYTNSKGKEVNSYYVLTVPYTDGYKQGHCWNFDPAQKNTVNEGLWGVTIGDGIEDWNNLAANAELSNDNGTKDYDFSTTYKVRRYDDGNTGTLTYINVPVAANKKKIQGDNARLFDNTAGLLFTAEPKLFGTTTVMRQDEYEFVAYKDENNNQRYKVIEHATGRELTDVSEISDAMKVFVNNYGFNDIDKSSNNNLYITFDYGATMTIPNLKAGQHIAIKWDRYVGGKGDLMAASNVTDLEGTPINSTFYVGVGPHNGNGFHQFVVAADGDVTFTQSQTGWTNIRLVIVKDVESTDSKNETTDLRLVSTIDDNGTIKMNAASKLVYIRKATGGSNLSDNYTWDYGNLRSSSCTNQTGGNVFYSVASPTGTLTTSNVTIDNTATVLNRNAPRITIASGAHGRFTLKQDCRVGNTGGGTYLLDRNEYVIKVYEYDYTQQTYPYTWDMTNINTSTGNNTLAEMTADAALTDDEDNHQYKYWTAPSGNDTDNYYTMNIGNPENLVGWRKKGDATQGLGQQDGSVIAELDGLGIVPVDLTDEANANIQFSSTGAGVRINGDGQQKIVVPGVDSGAKVYVAVSGGRITNAQDTEEATAESLTKSIDASDASVYVIDGTGEDVELYLSEGAVVKKVAVTKTFKSFNNFDGKSYTTEVRDHNEKYDLSGYFTGKGVTAQTVGAYEPREEGSKSGTLTLNAVEVAAANTPVILTCDTESPGSMPLFVKDVDTSESTVGTNYLVGNTGTSKIYAPKGSYILTNQYVPLDKDGNPTQTTPETGELAFYYVYADNKNGISPNKAYLQLSSSSGSGPNFIRAFYSFIGGDTTTEIGSLDEMDAVHEFTGPYYNLNGQKIDGKPTTKGIYIVNGKKVYVK